MYILDLFSFILYYYSFSLYHILHSISSRSISPLIQVIFHIWLSPSLSHFSAWSVGVSEEAREESTRRREDKGCTLSFFCFASERPARRLDYHVSYFVKECSIALWALSNTVPFFYCGQSWGKIFKRRGKFPVYSGAVFVFVQLCILALRAAPSVWTEF